MPETQQHNIKLGLLVLAGLILFITTLYIIGKNENIFGSHFELRARFGNVSGLMKGNNIRFSGIQAGTVKNISLINDTTIEVVMLIDNAMKPYINKNALASVGTEGLIGNKVINITPVRDRAPAAEEGDLLPVQKPVSTDEMLQTLYKTNNSIAEIAEGLKTTVRRVNNSNGLWGVLNEGSLAANMKTSLEHISQASANANGMVMDLHAIISDVRNGKGSVGALLKDTSFAGQLGEAVERIKSAGDKAGSLADELNQTVRNIEQDINSGKGTIHTLLKDSVLAMNLNASLENARKGTDAFNKDMEALKHNFLFRGYFRKLEKQSKNEIEKAGAGQKDNP